MAVAIVAAVVLPGPSAGEGPEPGIGEQKPAPLDLLGREIHLGLSGAVQLDVIHDFDAVGLDGEQPWEYITAEIPASGSGAARITNQTSAVPNQSNLQLWAWTTTPWGRFKVYSEFNLTGDEFGIDFEVYKVWGEWGWLRGGLDYSAFLNQSTIPDTLDFEGPNAIPEPRFGQGLVEIPLERVTSVPGLFLTLGLEDAEADLTPPPGASPTDQVPALIAKLGYEPKWADIELAGLYRRLRAEGPGYDSSVNGWGLMLSGSIDTWDDDNLILGILGGAGLGAYIDDTQGFGLDAAPRSAADTRLRAIRAVAAWGAYQHWWRQALRSTAAFGYVWLDNEFDPVPNPDGTYQSAVYASVNLIWSPLPPFDVGLEYLFGSRWITENTAVSGTTAGSDHRLMLSLRWNFQLER